MKIRTSFVTNSSSSSFILGFNSEKEILNIKNNIPDYWKESISESVIEDVIKGITTKNVVLNYFYENIDEYDMVFKGKRLREYAYKDIENNIELKKYIEEHKEKQLSEFKEKLEKYNIFSIVEYSDNEGDINSKLEHEIMPYTENTIEAISHH